MRHQSIDSWEVPDSRIASEIHAPSRQRDDDTGQRSMETVSEVRDGLRKGNVASAGRKMACAECRGTGSRHTHQRRKFWLDALRPCRSTSHGWLHYHFL